MENVIRYSPTPVVWTLATGLILLQVIIMRVAPPMQALVPPFPQAKTIKLRLKPNPVKKQILIKKTEWVEKIIPKKTTKPMLTVQKIIQPPAIPKQQKPSPSVSLAGKERFVPKKLLHPKPPVVLKKPIPQLIKKLPIIKKPPLREEITQTEPEVKQEIPEPLVEDPLLEKKIAEKRPIPEPPEVQLQMAKTMTLVSNQVDEVNHTPIGAPATGDTEVELSDIKLLGSLIRQYIAGINLLEYYPQSAIRRNIKGTVFVSLQFGTQAKMQGLDLKTTSGYSILDRAAFRMIEDHENELSKIIGHYQLSFSKNVKISLPISFSFK